MIDFLFPESKNKTNMKDNKTQIHTQTICLTIKTKPTIVTNPQIFLDTIGITTGPLKKAKSFAIIGRQNQTEENSNTQLGKKIMSKYI